jgi:hypothetical protein
MRKPSVCAVLMLGILVVSALAAWAATAQFTPPAQPGDIFAVINFDKSHGANRVTQVSVTWGRFRRTELVGQPYGLCANASPAGFVLMVRNPQSTTFPFTVSTTGTIVRGPYQGIAPPEISHRCYKLVKFRARF